MQTKLMVFFYLITIYKNVLYVYIIQIIIISRFSFGYIFFSKISKQGNYNTRFYYNYVCFTFLCKDRIYACHYDL